MEQKSKQETFEKVAKHLLEQNAVCEDASKCLYRRVLPDGTVQRCAAGCLIPDDKYEPRFEGRVIFDIEDVFIDLGYKSCLELIQRLQDIHDYTEVSNWPRDLITLAENRGLTVPQFLLDAAEKGKAVVES